MHPSREEMPTIVATKTSAATATEVTLQSETIQPATVSQDQQIQDKPHLQQEVSLCQISVEPHLSGSIDQA